jgi:hypothetical protein
VFPNRINGSTVGTDEIRVCARCDIRKSGWGDNNGRGFEKEYQVYCCQGCSENTGCTCQALVGKEPQPDYPDQLEDQRSPESSPEAPL